MVHSGESFKDSSADRAQDEHRGEVGVTDESAAQDAALVILPMHIAGNDAHELVWQRNAGILRPPAVHNQCDIETCQEREVVGALAGMRDEDLETVREHEARSSGIMHCLHFSTLALRAETFYPFEL